MRDELFIESIIDGRLHVLHNGEWMPVPSGAADPPEGEQPEEPEAPAAEVEAPEPEANAAPEVPELFDDVDDDGLRALHGQLDEYRVSARERQDIESVRGALAQQQRIVDELNGRKERAEQLARDLAELDGAEVPALPEPTLAGAGASAAQLAAARGAQASNEQVPPAPAAERQRVTLLASAGTEVLPSGAPMGYDQLGVAIERSKRGHDGQTILASIPAFEETPEGLPTLLSERNGATLNDELIREAVDDWKRRVHGEEPIQASARQGAICQPYDIIREIPDAFVTDTPVEDIFPTRPAGRGGFTFTPSGTLADVVGSTRIWNETDQAAVNPANSATWKPCIEYACPSTSTAVLEAVTQCVKYDITLDMSNPERVRNLNNAVSALVARTSEGRILQRIDQLSHGYVYSGEYGALPLLIEAINTLLVQLTYKNRERLGEYVMIVPPGVPEILTIDRANRAYGAENETSDVMAYLRANVEGVRSVVQSLDASLATEPGLPFAGLPPVGNQASAGAVPYINGGVYRIRLLDPSAFIHASTGEINAGTLRDSSLTLQNKTGYFAERFFFLAKHGPQPSATIDIQLCADGARAGLVTPHNCLTS